MSAEFVDISESLESLNSVTSFSVILPDTITAPVIVAVHPTFNVPPTIALDTDILPSIVAVTPVKFVPSP